MNHRFTIDPAKVDINDVSSLFSKMYPEAGMFGLTLIERDESGKLIYSSSVEVNADELVKYIEENAAAAKAKREDKMLQFECKVIKYKGNYYILDTENGNEVKIPLFD
jgi:hypothetical protein